jgi:outer membrane lipoprotein carrier protein
MKIYLILITLFVGGTLFAQSDKDAEKLLENVVSKTSSYKDFKAELAYTMVNKEMNIDEKKQGVIFIEGDKYRIEMEGQVIISDGKTIWTYLKDSDEVMISNMEDSDESVSPTKILTTYNKDFKAKFSSDPKYKNSDLKMIDLKPNNGNQFENMSILVNQKNLSLESFSLLDKNGNIFTYHIISLTPNIALPANTFSFNEADYPGVEVIDMR